MSGLLYQIIDQFVILRPVIIFTLFGTAITLVAALLLTGWFGWRKKNIRLMGFFYGIKTKHSMLLACGVMKMFLVFSLIATGCYLEPVHLVLYGAISIFYIICRGKLGEAFFSLLNSVLIMAVLYIISFLYSYLRDVSTNIQLQIIMVLLFVFLFFISIYDIVWSVMNIATDIDTESKLTKVLKAKEDN